MNVLRYQPLMAVLLSSVLSMCLVGSVYGQNTGGVFGPVINEGHQALQWRSTFDPDSDRFAHRLHFEQSLNTEVMWRVVAASREVNGSEMDFDFVQTELFWQVTPDGQRYQTGLRFDARLRDRGRPQQLGVNWTNQWQVTPKDRVRFNVLTAVEVGENRRDGVFLGTLGLYSRALSEKVFAGAELYSSYGSTDDLGGFDSQSHQLGPLLSMNLGRGWQVYLNGLFGLSDASPDQQWRIWWTLNL